MMGSLTLGEIQELVGRIAHWIDVETEVPVLHKYASALSPGQLYFEVGTAFGCSAIVAAPSAPRGIFIWTIDQGARHVAKTGSLDNYVAKVEGWFEEYGVSDKIHFWLRDSATMPWFGVDVDLLFINGNHDYETVKIDIEKWAPRVSAGGVVLFHYCNAPSMPGVVEAVEELMVEPYWAAEAGRGRICAFRRSNLGFGFNFGR